MADPSVSPEPVLHVAAGLWAAGVLKSGIELKLFDALAPGAQDVAALSQALGAAPASLRVVLDALVAMGFVARQARGIPSPRYRLHSWSRRNRRTSARWWQTMPIAQPCLTCAKTTAAW